MSNKATDTALERIMSCNAELTLKERIIATFILNNPRKAVFMTTNQLSRTCLVSKATVVRFVRHLGYDSYNEFLQSLRDYVDTELTLLDRAANLEDLKGDSNDRLRRAIYEEMDNLKLFYENVDRSVLNAFVDNLNTDTPVFIVGSRITMPFASYFGWSLTKVRNGVNILPGSDSTTIDWLTISSDESAVVILTTSRYPNELIRLGKMIKRQQKKLMVITDSSICPLIQFADLLLIAPSSHIPFIGSPTTMICIINYLVTELASRRGRVLKAHHEKLELAYHEHDIMFNLTDKPNRPT